MEEERQTERQARLRTDNQRADQLRYSEEERQDRLRADNQRADLLRYRGRGEAGQAQG